MSGGLLTGSLTKERYSEKTGVMLSLLYNRVYGKYNSWHIMPQVGFF